MVAQAYGRVATWLTDKTETSEVLFMGKYGIASFKVVRSGNGKKVSVYSGFDTPSWPWDDEKGCMEVALWEHRYVEAQEKAAHKWRSAVGDIPRQDCHAILDSLDADTRDALRQAIASDEKVQAHWQMITGVRTGEPSGKPRQGQPGPYAPKAPKPSAKDEFRAKVEADEGWGVF